MTETDRIFPPAVIAAEFTTLADVLKRYGVVHNTILKAADEGNFPKGWRIKGALYWRNRDLLDHDAKVAAAVAAPTDHDTALS